VYHNARLTSTERGSSSRFEELDGIAVGIFHLDLAAAGT
jgi:hypothetical protein